MFPEPSADEYSLIGNIQNKLLYNSRKVLKKKRKINTKNLNSDMAYLNEPVEGWANNTAENPSSQFDNEWDELGHLRYL